MGLKDLVHYQMKETSRSLYKRPDIAWPTIVVFIIATFFTLVSWSLGTGVLLPIQAFDYSVTSSYLYWFASTILGVVCFLLSTVCAYTQFTVAHEAVHGAISKKYKSLNDWIGWAGQVWLGPTSGWHTFKYNHLEHHAHTNHSSLDPDYWCSLKGPGGKYLTPVRWLCVDVSYFYMYYIRHLYKKSFTTQLKAYSYELFKIGFLVFAYQWGYFPFLLQYWILPSRAALFMLAYAFDFLPHFPHDITRKDNRYQTTAYLHAPWIFRPLLSLLTFYQNYHIIHHLNPSIPFYIYKDVWNDTKDELLEEEIIIRNILPTLLEKPIVHYLGDDEYDQLQRCKTV